MFGLVQLHKKSMQKFLKLTQKNILIQLPILSSGTLFQEHGGFHGIRLITFICQTQLWNKKGLALRKEAVPYLTRERCELQPKAILSNALKTINKILLPIRKLAGMLVLHSLVINRVHCKIHHEPIFLLRFQSKYRFYSVMR